MPAPQKAMLSCGVAGVQFPAPRPEAKLFNRVKGGCSSGPIPDTPTNKKTSPIKTDQELANSQ